MDPIFAMTTPKGSVTVQRWKDYEVGVSLMQQDMFNMGQEMGNNVFMLFHAHSTEKARYIILVNTETGESVKVSFAK
jgi:hypothetical protein